MSVRPDVKLRIALGRDIALGPGKAELLALIAETGSIAAAGRRMGLGYKRAWMLVETMNRCFRTPLVESSRGGSAHGGAALTPTGTAVLAAYRRLAAGVEASADFAAVAALLQEE